MDDFVSVRPQLPIHASEDCTNSCSSDSGMDFMVFLVNQVYPIIVCGFDITVHVMLAFGLYG